MTIFTARVAAVNTLPLGSVLIEDAPIGATELTVEDGADFNASGGYAILGGTEVVEFSSADDEARTLTLVAPLTAAWPADTRVELWDETANTLVVETVAQLLSEGGDAGAGDSLEAIVDHSLIPFLPEGIRGGTEDEPARGPVGEAVEVERRGDELVVVNILGQAPVLNGAMIDPDTLPVTPPAEPQVPETPAAPTLIGGIGTLLVRWEAVEHPNPVMYEVHASDAPGATLGAATLIAEVAGTQATVRRLPKPDEESGSEYTLLRYGTVYYVSIVAKDTVDPAYASDPSPEGVGSPMQATGDDIAVESVTADHLTANSVDASKLAADLVISSNFKTAETGQRVEFDPAGIRLHGPDNDVRIDLPTAPGADPTFRGSVQADGLTVREGATFYSPWNEFARDSVINLAEQVAGPVAGPIATPVWDGVTLERTKFAGQLGEFWLDASQIVGVGRDVRGGASRVLIMQKRSGGTRIWFYEMNGALSNLFVGGVLQPFLDVLDFEVTGAFYPSGGGLTWFGKWAQNGDWYFKRPDGSFSYYPANNPGSNIAMSWNGSEIAVAEKNTSATYRFRTVDATTAPATVVSGFIGSGTSVRNSRITFVYKGNADFGGQKYVVAHEDAAYRVYSAGSTQPEFNWDPPTAVRKGAFWDAATGRFYTIGGDGVMYTHEPLTWTDPVLDTWHVGQSFYDANPTGGTHETALGALTTFTMKKRAKVLFTLADVPTGSGGPDDPTHWRLYVKRGAAPAADRSDIYLQLTGPASVKTATLVGAPVTTGTTAKQFGDFANAAPARVRSARTFTSNPTRPILELRGDGGGQWGSIEVRSDGVVGSDWVNMTMPSTFSTVGSFTPPRTRRGADGVWAIGRIQRSSNATGIVTWANIPDPTHWPPFPWELTGYWQTGSATGYTRAYVDSDGGVRTANTPAGLTQIYFSVFYPFP
jgi:hypothetical protein